MRQIKKEFFSTGFLEQKKPDIMIDLKRLDESEISKWTPEQKKKAREFIKDCQRSWNRFVIELLKQL